MLFAVILGLSAWAPTGAAMETISGTARVLHANLIYIEGVHLRLFAIDVLAPEQTCDNGLVEYPCGQVAAGRLAHALGNQTVVCEVQAEEEPDQDSDVGPPQAAVCHVGEVDIAEWLVRTGFAFAERARRDVYAAAEDEAHGMATGIWRGPFVLPWDWRAGLRDPNGPDYAPE
jgi:endonuclease YncB( thermonuclease family)